MANLSGREEIKGDIPIHRFIPFANHPRREPSGSHFEAFCEDVRANGVLTPIIARFTRGQKDKAGDELYEIISGHCRWKAAKEAGLSKIPAIIKIIQDADAAIQVTSSNFGNNNLSPCEIGKFCKLWMDGNSKQGKRLSNGDEMSGRKLLAKMFGLNSEIQVYRYMRYYYLIREFQDFVDNKKEWLGIGVNISFLDEGEQQVLFRILSDEKHELTRQQSIKLKETKRQSDSRGNVNTLTEEQIKSILSSSNNETTVAKKRKSSNIKVSIKSIERYLSRHFDNLEPSEEDIHALIIKALEAYGAEK